MIKSIIALIVTYNRLELLADAIKSIRNQSYLIDILVVNNGSTDGTTEWLETQSDLVVINQENVGGAGGFYAGFKYAAECRKYDFVWAMDDDIIARPDTLEELIKAYNFLSENNESVGILASEVLDKNDNPVNVPRILSGKINISGYQDWPKYLSHGIVPIDIATFVSLLIPVPVIREIGLPIKEFFIWGDDTEYTLRASERFSNFLVGKSKITHLRNGGIISIENINEERRIRLYKYKIRNTIFLYRKGYMKDGSLSQLIKVYLRKIIKFTLKGNFLKSKIIFEGILESRMFNPSIKFPNQG